MGGLFPVLLRRLGPFLEVGGVRVVKNWVGFINTEQFNRRF